MGSKKKKKKNLDPTDFIEKYHSAFLVKEHERKQEKEVSQS